MKNVYFENHANTRVDERAIEEMKPYLGELYGSAQSIHSFGAKSKDALDKARSQVASLIGAAENEIYFTSCGSESNNLAVKGAADAHSGKGRHIIMSSVEHFSVLYSGRRLEKQGFQVTYLPVDKYGMVSPGAVREAIKPDTILIPVQYANSEVGTLQPVEEIAKIAKEKGVLFHTDAVAAAGIIPLDVKKLGADMMSLAGSQFYGPKGAAALFIKKGVRVTPQIDGGVQENGRRAGGENIPGIVGMGKAAELAAAEMDGNSRKMSALRDRLVSGIGEIVKYAYVNGHPQKRIPNNINFSIEFIEGEGMFLLLDAKGIYVSSGSSCASKALKMSHVLTAMNVDTAVGQGSIVITLSKYNTAEDAEYFLAEFPPIVERLRAMSPLYAHFQKTGTRKVAGPGTDYEHEHEAHTEESA